MMLLYYILNINFFSCIMHITSVRFYIVYALLFTSVRVLFYENLYCILYLDIINVIIGTNKASIVPLKN